MERILITGGAGFIGANLVRKLTEDGNYKITVVDNLSSGRLENIHGLDCEFVNLDICDSENDFFRQENEFHVIVHLAARGSVPRSVLDPIKTVQVNVNGTQNLLEYARRKKPLVIFASSSSVYGGNTKIPKSELDWLRPSSPYAASKLAGEALVQAYASVFEIPALILRFFNVYGPLQSPQGEYSAVLPRWIWNLLGGKEIQIFGDGKAIRDFTFVGTVIDLMVSAIKNHIQHESPINVAWGEEVSLNEVVRLLEKEFPNLTYSFSSKRTGDVAKSQNDPRLVKSLFPNIEPTPFSHGLKKTIDWLNDEWNREINGR